jgi:hypothetical protein
VIKNVCNHFYEMPANTIREQTFCCGSGAGLNAGEDMELRMAGGLPRANAVKHVHEAHGVNMLATICAIDRAALPDLMSYWVPGSGCDRVHEMVANALILPGEKEREPPTCAANRCREWRKKQMGQKDDSITGIWYFRRPWSRFPSGTTWARPPKPEPVLTEKAKARAKECVAQRRYMKADHMQLLDVWRDTVTRRGERIYVNAREGVQHEPFQHLSGLPFQQGRVL